MIDEGQAGIRRLRARALRHVRSRDLTRASTPKSRPSFEPGARDSDNPSRPVQTHTVLEKNPRQCPPPQSSPIISEIPCRPQKETHYRSRAAKFSYHTLGSLGTM